MKFKSGLLAASAFAAAMTATAAFAQDGIEVVTVTAAKRAMDVQDVPISMNVVGAAQLNKFNTASLTGLMASVPSLMLQRSPTNVGLFMRGYGTGPANPSSDLAVSVYQDGIPQEKSRNLMIDFFDVQRIEVLRGAQGALVGKNTLVGAVSIISAEPTDTFEGKATVNYNFDFQGVDTYGYISGPITDSLSARLAVKVVSTGGYIKNLSTNRDEPDLNKQQARLTLKFKPSESITDTLRVEYSNWNQWGNTQLPGNPNLGVSTANKAACCTKSDAGPIGSGSATFDRQHGWRLSNILDVDLGDGYTLSSITGYTAYNSNSLGAGAATNPSGFGTRFPEKYSGGSQEVRLLSPTGEGNAFDWIVGAYIDYSNYHIDNTIDYLNNVAAFSGGLGNGGLALHFSQRNSAYSVYASGTYHFTDDLRLIANARYTRSSKSATYMQEQRYGARTAATGGVAGQPFFVGVLRTNAGNNGSSFFDPSITLQYDMFDDRVKLYASWAKGSKGAAFDALNRTVLVGAFVFRPETSTNWEIGAKTKLYDWLAVDIAAYWMNIKNMQVAGFDPAFNALITRNAGEAESKGVELQVNLSPVEGLSINNAVNYIDARFTDYPGASCLPAQNAAFPSPYGPAPGVVCAAATNNLAGVPLQHAPQWSGNTQIDYTMPVMDELKINLSANWQWRGPIWLAPNYVMPYGKHGGINKLDLRAGLAEAEDMWEIAIVAKNVTNTLSTNSAATLWNLEGGKAAETEIFLDEPRNISIQGTLRF